MLYDGDEQMRSEVDDLVSVAQQQLDLGRSEKALKSGTRIDVPGHGEGTYVQLKKKWRGANEHTIAFDAKRLN